MSEMIERVARAIAISGNGGTWDDWYNQDQKEFHRKRARAAIEAMREPTEKMSASGCPNPDDGGAPYCYDRNVTDEAYKAMIDTALNND